MATPESGTCPPDKLSRLFHSHKTKLKLALANQVNLAWQLSAKRAFHGLEYSMILTSAE